MLSDAGEYKPTYFWTDNEGNKLTFKEFMSRWKEGIEGITPLQQVKGQLNATYIMLVGIFCGFVVTLFAFKNLWWLTIILGAAFFNTIMQLIGVWQKKNIFETMEKGVKVNE